MIGRRRSGRGIRTGWWLRNALVLIGGGALLYAVGKPQHVPEPESRPPRSVSVAATAMSAAETAFRALVRGHPSPEVRAILPMLEDGRVRFATRYVDPEQGEIPVRDIMYVNGVRTIVATEAFLLGPRVPPCVRTVALRHEVEHLRDDLAGMRMAPLVFHDRGEGSTRDVVRRVLHAEWRADIAQRDVEASTGCRYIHLFGASEQERCAAFRKQMLTDGVHLAPELLARYPAVAASIMGADCASLSGPY